ncbi:hypothetical protein BASA81_000595 [Batrachochytrium salamandrivorans]|nr:hypothetical protein BASA81_000595 [Batrachochytrium salamandrivorans]
MTSGKGSPVCSTSRWTPPSANTCSRQRPLQDWVGKTLYRHDRASPDGRSQLSKRQAGLAVPRADGARANRGAHQHGPATGLSKTEAEPKENDWKNAPIASSARLLPARHHSRPANAAAGRQDPHGPRQLYPRQETDVRIRSEGSRYLFTKLLERKTKEHVLETVLQVQGFLESKGLKLSSVHCDSEEVFKSLQTTFMPPGVHERVSERAIRTLKSWLRTNLSALDYNLPTQLFTYLLLHVTRVLNDSPQIPAIAHRSIESARNWPSHLEPRPLLTSSRTCSRPCARSSTWDS